MSDVISTASSALQLVSRLREINRKIANSEFANALADLSIELSELKIQVASLLEENDQLKRQLLQRPSEALEFKGFAYYTRSGDGPFCSGCYDSHGKSIRLTRLSGPFTAFGSHSCPSCKESYHKG